MLPIGVSNYSRIHVRIYAFYVLFPLSITFNIVIGNIGNIYRKALGDKSFSCFRMSCRLEETATTGNIFLLPMNCALHPIGNTPGGEVFRWIAVGCNESSTNARSPYYKQGSGENIVFGSESLPIQTIKVVKRGVLQHRDLMRTALQILIYRSVE